MGNKSRTELTQLRWSTAQLWGNGQQVAGTSGVNSAQYTSFLQGSEDPQWRKKVQMNESATGPLTAELKLVAYNNSGKVDISYDDPTFGGKQHVKVNGFSRLFGPANFVVGNYTAHLGQVDNRALVKLYKDLNSKDTAWLGGVFVKEFREVVSMLRNPFKNLRKGLGDYIETATSRCKRVRRWSGRAREVKKILADTWLEYTFGWQPLVNDIRDAASVFAHNEDLFPRLHGRGQAYEEWNADWQTDDTTFAGAYFDGIIKNTRSVRVIYRAGMQTSADYPAGSFQRIRQLSGFKWKSFIPTVWEIIPYSFVVDYFTNFGDILECTTLSRADVRWVARTVVYTDTVFKQQKLNSNLTLKNFANVKGLSISGDGFCWVLSQTKRVERAQTGLRFPTPEFRMPAIDSRRWLNIAALVSQGRSSERILRG